VNVFGSMKMVKRKDSEVKSEVVKWVKRKESSDLGVSAKNADSSARRREAHMRSCVDYRYLVAVWDNLGFDSCMLVS
jgi:hypothetical protein